MRCLDVLFYGYIFRKVVDDPSGDSFIENLNAPKKDPKLIQTYYRRNKEQNELLGIEVWLINTEYLFLV